MQDERMPRGRPLQSLSDAIKKRFTDLLMAGISQNEALVICSLNEPSVRRERKRDANFDDSVKKAALEGKASLIFRIVKATGERWSAAAWLLERKYWQEFAARRPDAYTGEDLAAIAVQMADVARRYVPKDKLPQFSEEVQEVLRGYKHSKARRKT